MEGYCLHKKSTICPSYFLTVSIKAYYMFLLKQWHFDWNSAVNK